MSTTQSRKKLKIAFIGNMNNNHFAMARYLRDEGYDCELLLFPQELVHFHPSCDTYCLGYRDWTYQMPWGSRQNFLEARPDELRKLLSKYDIRVGCGLAPGLCHRAGVPLDVFVPYGGDLWSETQYGVHRAMLNSVAATTAQRSGLASVAVVHATQMIESYEAILNRYWKGGTRWYEGIPMVYAPEYSQANLEKMMNRSHWGHEFKRIRESCEFMVVAHGRHVWGGKTNPSVKGNDILLEGWSIFIKRNKSFNAKLVLLEYGENCDRSKEMVRLLRLGESVEWLPKMFRKDIMPGLFLADVVAGEFVHSWNAGGVIYEALVASKPLIMHRDDSALIDNHESLFPICKASTSEEVANQLQFLVDDPALAKKMGDGGHNWYMNHVVRCGTERYIDLFESLRN